ncbi:MAG: hypothetical protein JWM78_2313 [Verrucomicrobiaceae bacterium]|nr:hypothetical protein [Verrucomicrobiaceae bacterium]
MRGKKENELSGHKLSMLKYQQPETFTVVTATSVKQKRSKKAVTYAAEMALVGNVRRGNRCV